MRRLLPIALLFAAALVGPGATGDLLQTRRPSPIIFPPQKLPLSFSHVDHLTFPVLRRSRTPVVTTLHGRLDIPGLGPMLRHFDDMPMISISDAQREPIADAGWMRTIHHGLPLENYEVGSGRGDYVVFLGRISPEKRVDRAIEIAIRAGKPLMIAAKVDRADQEYFEEKIAPLLNHPLIHYLGEQGEEEQGVHQCRLDEGGPSIVSMSGCHLPLSRTPRPHFR